MSCEETFMDMVIKVENTFVQPIEDIYAFTYKHFRIILTP